MIMHRCLIPAIVMILTYAICLARTANALDQQDILLGNQAFKVVIDTPAQLTDDFPACRFDQTANVRSVTFHGREYLVSPGFIDEFGILGCGVLGFDEAQIGEPFIKIGIGYLQRIAEPEYYHFSTVYPIFKKFPVEIQNQTDSHRRHKM
jgi:hypothetical protein